MVEPEVRDAETTSGFLLGVVAGLFAGGIVGSIIGFLLFIGAN